MTRVIVCGTGFGRVYLAGLGAQRSPLRLAGILARGSERSWACARRWQVPLYQHVDQVPGDIDVACVVVGSAINGGPGARLATDLMARGVHVLQEHPLHAEELAGCLRTARKHQVRYRINTHHVHVAPVRRFIAAARVLLREQPLLFIDAVTSFQVLYTLLDILGSVLGRLRPWGFAPPTLVPPRLREMTSLDLPFRSIDGVLAGVPLTLRVQNQMEPREPDNHAHLWHRITIGAEGGNLTLISSTGPVVWTQRQHLPITAAGETGFDRLADPSLAVASTVAIGPSEAPSWRQTLVELWPEAVRVAMRQFVDDIAERADPLAVGQYHLGLCRLTREITDLLGPVELVTRRAPRLLVAQDIVQAADVAEREVLA